MKHTLAAERQENSKQKGVINFCTISLEGGNEQSSLESEIKWVNVNEASENKSEVELFRALAEVSSSVGQLQTARRRKLKNDWCEEIVWLALNHTIGIVSCEVCDPFPSTADQNSKVVKGFPGPFKLETFKRLEKSFQHQKCVKADNALLVPEAILLAIYMKWEWIEAVWLF